MAPNELTKAILVDDNSLVVDTLAVDLAQNHIAKVHGTASDLDSGRQLVEKGGFDLLVTGLYFSDKRDGLDLVRLARQKHPGCTAVVLSYSTRAEDILDADNAGADAYLIKDCDLDEITESLRSVTQRGAPSLLSRLKTTWWNKARKDARRSDRRMLAAKGEGAGDVRRTVRSPEASAGEMMTQRELRILKLMAEGFTNEEIAARLFHSNRVIRRANTSIYRKLEVRNRSEAIARALKEKII